MKKQNTKYRLYLLLIICIQLYSCTPNNSSKNNKNKAIDANHNCKNDIINYSSYFDSLQKLKLLKHQEKNCILILDSTIRIKNIKFDIQVEYIDNYFCFLKIKRNSKLIIKDSLDLYDNSEVKFNDFNQDGYLDVVFYQTDNFSYNEVYLFNPKSIIFTYVKELSFYPYLEPLKTNKKYFYSYEVAGCSDMNWASNLIYIKNYKAISLGRIYGQGCDEDIKENKQYIEIEKIINPKKEISKKIKTLTYSKYIKKHEDKFEFIDTYWNKNYKLFSPNDSIYK